MTTESHLEDYAKDMLRVLNDLMGLQVTLRVDSETPHYSYLEKDILKADGKKFLLSACIGLNMGLLTTRRKVKRAIAHEFAHLIPGDAPFDDRWKLWVKICSQAEHLIG